MPSGFDMRALAVPVIVAPMAGGPSTPELAAAGTNAGGLGFVAAGYLTADTLAERIIAARRLTTGPLGVNLFAPQPSAATPDGIEKYAAALAPDAERYGAKLGDPVYTDDAWAAKLDVLLDLRPEVASFTFGLPSEQECKRLRDAGITTVGTVTTLDEADAAVDCGVDAVAVQGASAGGHRGTFDPVARRTRNRCPSCSPLSGARVGVPIIAAGGLVTADDVNRVISGRRGRGATRHGVPARRRGGQQSRPPSGAAGSAVHRNRCDQVLFRALRARAAQPVHRRARGAGAVRIPRDPLSDQPAAGGVGARRRPARHQRVGGHRISKSTKAAPVAEIMKGLT